MYVKGKKGDPHEIIITLSNLFTTPLATGVPFSWKDLTPVALPLIILSSGSMPKLLTRLLRNTSMRLRKNRENS
jgi:hypothetical protein